MSRHGYSDGWDGDWWPTIMWNGRVASAIRGKRGQVMLRELRDALDAMESKELIRGSIVASNGCCCAIGALLKEREVPYLDRLIKAEDDQYILEDWNDDIAEDLDVATPLIQEIAYMNDEGGFHETPAGRWRRMRDWVDKKITD